MAPDPSNTDPCANRRGRGIWRWIAVGVGILAVGLLFFGSRASAPRVVNGWDVGRMVQGMASGDPMVRASALEDLRALGTNAVPVLLGLADQRDPWTRQVFDRLGPSLPTRQKGWLRAWWRPHAAMVERQQATAALCAMTNTAALVPVWGRLIRHPDRGVANQAWTKLREAGPAGIGAWQTAMRDSDPYVRRIAVGGLVGLGDAAAPALPEIRRAIKDPDPDVRRTALGVLLGLQARAWPDLIELGSSPGDPLRARAIAGIAESPAASRSNVVHVLAWTRDPDPVVRRTALPGLAWIRPWSPEIEAAVTAGCRSSDSTVRAAALLTMGRAGRRASGLRQLAESCLLDPDEAVRAAAISTLKTLGGFPLDRPLPGLKTAPHALDVPQDRAPAPVPAVGGVNP